MRRPIKILVIIFGIIIILVVLVISFISPITKYLIEKYDEKYTGRQITLDWAYVNPFTGYVYFRNLKIYELKSDSIFLSASSLSVNIAMHKLLSKTYEITELTLNNPHGSIIQNIKTFNFDDIIKRFSSKSTSKIVSAPIHFSILSIKIVDGEFHYREVKIPINYFIKMVNFESTGIQWNSDTVGAKFSFSSGIGTGDVNGNFTINFKNEDYRLEVVAKKFDANFLIQYVKDLSNYGYFKGNIDANLKSKGNFKDAEDVTISGQLGINEFHFGKNPKEDYGSFDKFSVAIFELSPKNNKYLFDSASLIHPYFKFELYDHLDNMQNMFGKTADFNIIVEIAKYIKILAKNFFRSNYKINRLAIYKADLKFNDFTINEEFSSELDPLYIFADSINRSDKRVNVYLKSGIKPYGNAKITLSINPIDSTDFDLDYQLQKLPVTMFNPYILNYTSFPLDRGTVELNGKWHVRKGVIKSDNHLVVIDPRVSKRLRNKDLKWIPVPLIMAFIRERGNVIDYKIPITGDLKNPKFHLRDVLADLLTNIFVKPPTTAYGIEVKNIENEIEKSLTLKWETRQSGLRPIQDRFIEKIADFLEKNPDARIDVYPQQYALKEKEYITFFEAKKKYFLLTHNKNAKSFNEEDSVEVERMKIKDIYFVQYLNRQVTDPLVFTIQEKCSRLIGAGHINARFERLNKERKNVFIQYMKQRNVEKQVKFFAGKDIIPYNGFSFYKIEYKGELPKQVLKAYRKMNEVNNEAPRNRFKEDRKKNKNTDK